MVGAARDRATAAAGRQVDQAKQQVTDRLAEEAGRALDRLTGQKPDSAAAGADTVQAPALQDQVKSILKGLRGGKGK